jgi:hypothetical protein
MLMPVRKSILIFNCYKFPLFTEAALNEKKTIYKDDKCCRVVFFHFSAERYRILRTSLTFFARRKFCSSTVIGITTNTLVLDEWECNKRGNYS